MKSLTSSKAKTTMKGPSADNFTFFWGAAAGTDRKVLKTHQEENVIINFSTQNNNPWDGIENLFIDSGGYSRMLDGGEYRSSIKEYVDFINRYDPNYFALRDYPITKEILKKTNESVENLQKKTLEAHFETLEHYKKSKTSAKPVAVIHGKNIKDYLQMIKRMNHWGILNRIDHLGIGGLKSYSTNTLKNLIKKTRKNTPTHIKLHGFGIGVSQLIEGELYSILDSADSQDYSIRGRHLDEHQNGQINRFTAVSNAYTSKKIKLMKELKANISQNHTQYSIIDSLGENKKTRIEKTNDLIRTLNSLKQDLIEKNIYKNEQHLLCKECLYSDDRPDNLLYCPVFEHECPYSEF